MTCDQAKRIDVERRHRSDHSMLTGEVCPGSGSGGGLPARATVFPNSAQQGRIPAMSAVTVGVLCPRKGWFGRPHGECRFKPLHDRVLIKRIDADEKTSVGLIIPDAARAKPQHGGEIAVRTGMRASNGQ